VTRAAGADGRSVIGAEISATSVATSRHEREERVEKAPGICSATGRSPGLRKAGRSQHGEIVSPGTGSATKHVRGRATHKSSVLHANPGPYRNRVQLPTRRRPSPNRSRARSRKLNTAKVVAVVVVVEAAESGENGPSKESRVHRAASEAIVDPKLVTALLRETQRRSK
jgi:hypothetical protein